MFKSDEKTMNDRDAKKISELVQQLKPMVNKEVSPSSNKLGRGIGRMIAH
jgi:hypothetical protein